MSVRRAFIKASVALALTSVPFLTTSASGQAPAARPSTGAVSEPQPGSAENRVAPKDPQTENAEVRELLRKMEEQQKILLEQVDRLQRQLDGDAATDESIASRPIVPSTTVGAWVPAAIAALNSPPAVTDSASTSAQPASDDRYRDGIVIWETPEDAKVPFLLKFNVNTQLRYLNTLDSDETFTDHLGVSREVHTRNDITVNRAMFILGGYIFDQRARYSFTVWTSAGAASIIVASNIGWQFNKAFAITGGYTGVPGSRSLVATFPFFTATDRSMADNFFRPGVHSGSVDERRTRERAELSGVRRQRSQYPEYLGKQDRYASAGVRKCLVGTAGTLRGTRQITQHVR